MNVLKCASCEIKIRQETCRSSLFVIYTIIVTGIYVHSLVELKIIKKCTVPLLKIRNQADLHLKVKYDSSKVSIFVVNDRAKLGNWFQTFREEAVVAFSRREYAKRYQMSKL